MRGDAGQTKQPPMNRNNGANGGYFVCPTSSGLRTGPLPRVLPQLTGPEVPQVGPATNNPKQDYCLRQALKGAAKDISGISLADDVANFMTNLSFSFPSFLLPAMLPTLCNMVPVQLLAVELQKLQSERLSARKRSKSRQKVLEKLRRQSAKALVTSDSV
jgi:hypothetical protein